MAKLALLGGKKVREKAFAVHPVIGKEERDQVLEVLDNGELSGFLASPGDKFFGGEKVKKLERLFKEYFGVKYAMGINSATAGLHAAVAALNIGPGDEVLVTPYSMSASATAILMHNAIPIFVDIQEDIYCIDPQAIKKAITPRTKAIIVVHLFGHPADMDEIMAIAKEHKLKVIEDVAQAPGAIYKGKYAGTIGDIGVFSFNQNKTITTGEGGVVITNDEELAKRVQLVRNHGEVVNAHIPTKTIAGILGWNYRMTELEAAVGVAQFAKLDKLTDHRIHLAGYLSKKISNFLPILAPPEIRSYAKHVYFVYPMKYNSAKAGIPRDRFAEAVRAEGVPMGAGYVRPIYLEPIYQQLLCYGDRGCPFTCPFYENKITYPKGACEICERMHYEELVITPICRYPLTEADIDDFVKAIEKVLENKEELIAAT